MIEADDLAGYGATLSDFLHTGSEEALYRASLLSSRFVNHGLGPEEIVAVHSEELERVAQQAPLRDRARIYANSLQFLLEVMIAYGVRYKEYLDLRLRESTRDVESRMAVERATANEKIRAEMDALRSKEDFLNFIAHELRTPLTALHGHLQLLQRRQSNPNPERLGVSLAGMSHAVVGMRRLIDNLLTISRTEAGLNDQAGADLIHLGNLARTITEELGAVAAQQAVTIEVSDLEPVPMVRGNQIILESIIANLIGNAIKYSPNGGTVRISVDSLENQVRCSITDQGIGIPEPELPRIFEKYFRGGNTRSVQGVGLGLAVAQAAAQRHGGYIRVESKEGEGSTFYLILPAATESEA
ncbi:MAG: ATP-binding protein [Chloroflexota bacterium]